MSEYDASIPVRVLIVDDNPAKLMALTVALTDLEPNLEIVTATSGMEALRRLLVQQFVVVLLDVNMPIIDGFETARIMRLRPSLEHLPIIFITAEALADDARLKGYKLGAVDYILSPVLPQILRAKVAVFADLHRMHERLKHTIELQQENLQLRTDIAAVQKLNQEIAQKAQQLETANRDMEGFSYSVSHDLRSPLRAIDGFVAILQEDYAETLDAEGRRMFGIISANARKMGQLIDDILAFSRAVRVKVSQTPLDMNALVDEVWAGLAEQRSGRVVEFHRADLPGVLADPRALRQVWQNLLDNALKFTRSRDPARIEVDAERRGNRIWYWVRDNGTGFNPDYADKLFVLFQRLHGMDEFEGTGVGLAIAKRFIQKHGGQIVAEGILDVGATFSFSLPVEPGSASMPSI